MRFPDKNGPTLYPILKPPDLPDLFAVARTSAQCHDTRLFPQPATQDKSNTQSHEHRLRWVVLNICSNFRLPGLRPGLCIRPCLFYYILELRGLCFRR